VRLARIVAHRLRSLFRSSRVDADLRRELDIHLEQLTKHIDAFIESYNNTAEPFVWTKSKVYQRRVKGRRISEL